MAYWRAARVIDAPTERVWDVLVAWERSEWMVPPTTVEVLGDRRTGIGTRVRAVSVFVRMLRLVDTMVVTNWIEAREIRVRHVGWMVRGDGIFRLTPQNGATMFEWVEDLVLPFGVIGELLGLVLRPLAERYLRRSLARFAATVT